ncbi:40S ribosomal protein S19-3-like [Cucumis melo var. makuwa]|uniref:40S ribosomal protein S19-3-like n=1 Tax=Cucumis melo var. makuwa TaxID=1194695 RepID=A0A5D3CPQ4_CUCMM|nr:40S ribosomal protein S19-3-like [Cucumis melo var. makuwa]
MVRIGATKCTGQRPTKGKRRRANDDGQAMMGKRRWARDDGRSSLFCSSHFIEEIVIFLVELPPWADIVKAAGFKELAPYDAVGTTSSMARKIYSRGGLGVGALKQIYGGSKRNDTKILDQVAGQIVVIDQLPLFLN